MALLCVGHRRSNRASAAAIRRAGFVESGVERHIWPDGETDDDVLYELRLIA